jgi:acetoin utilization deacetylase AcuC-like enzyme
MRPAFVYSRRYGVDIGLHVFPTGKYDLVMEGLVGAGLVSRAEILEPEPPTRDDLLAVHTLPYLEDLRELRWSERTSRSELPLTREIVDAFLLAAGGTMLTCAEAMRRGRAVHIGGGLHHAFADHAEGFCYVNDVAVGIRSVQQSYLCRRVLIVDCDLHQGNGTAHIFRHDPSVYTFSIHQQNNYPVKEESDCDVGLEDGVGDGEYLARLMDVLPGLFEGHCPDLVVYLAGADPYCGDQLGGLDLSIEGLCERDLFVLGEAKSRGVPVATVLAGGYAWDMPDTVAIHINTCRAALEMCGEVAAGGGSGELAAGEGTEA